MSFADVTLDGLVKALSADYGPRGFGCVYKFDTPTGNRRFYQSYGTFDTYYAHTFSVWVKAVDSGVSHEEEVQLLGDELTGDWTTYLIRDDCWTRLVYYQCYNEDSEARFAGIKIGASSNGILCYGPQVVYSGGGDGTYFPKWYPGAYMEQWIAAPAGGTWEVGDKVYNSAPAAGGYIGWVCTAAGTPGTWKTFGAITA
jgi:hypothetical protein